MTASTLVDNTGSSIMKKSPFDLKILFIGINSSQVIISNTTEHINRLSKTRQTCQEVARQWLEKLRKSTPSKQLYLMYLFNDLVQIAAKNDANENLFECLKSVAEEAFSIPKGTANISKLKRILDIWAQRKIFSLQQIEIFKKKLYYQQESLFLMDLANFNLEDVIMYYKRYVEHKQKILKNNQNASDVKQLPIDSPSILKNRESVMSQIEKVEKSCNSIQMEVNSVNESQKAIFEYADILDDLSDCLNQHIATLNNTILKWKEVSIDLEDSMNKIRTQKNVVQPKQESNLLQKSDSDLSSPASSSNNIDDNPYEVYKNASGNANAPLSTFSASFKAPEIVPPNFIGQAPNQMDMPLPPPPKEPKRSESKKMRASDFFNDSQYLNTSITSGSNSSKNTQQALQNTQMPALPNQNPNFFSGILNTLKTINQNSTMKTNAKPSNSTNNMGFLPLPPVTQAPKLTIQIKDQKSAEQMPEYPEQQMLPEDLEEFVEHLPKL